MGKEKQIDNDKQIDERSNRARQTKGKRQTNET